MYTVIYDGHCNLCVTLVQLLEKLDKGQQFAYVPMQDEATLQSFGVTPADCELGMILIEPAEIDAERRIAKRWQGSDAAEEIGRRLPMGEIFVQAYRALPMAKPSGDKIYEYVRDNRYGLFGKRQKLYEPNYPACDTGQCRP